MSKIIVQPGQSLFDIAVKYYGTVEGVYDIICRNGLSGPTHNLYPGDALDLGSPPRLRVSSFLAPHQVATIEGRIRGKGIGFEPLIAEEAMPLPHHFTIEDTPRASLIATQPRVAEGSAVSINLLLSKPAQTRISVPIVVIAAGGATMSDYALQDAVGASISLADGYFNLILEPGEQAQRFFVVPTQDSLAETGEGLVLTLGEPLRGVARGAEHTITLPFTSREDKELIPISTLEQLDAMRYDLDGNGIPTIEGRVAYEAAFGNLFTNVRQYGGYRLAADLDFRGTKWENPTDGTFTGTRVDGGWQPIGGLFSSFAATFDGGGHTISNLYINQPSTSSLALFTVLRDEGVILNLRIEALHVSGMSTVAALAAFNYSRIINCSIQGSISGTSGVGGLTGQNHGSIGGCYTSGALRSNGSVGGIAGQNQGNGTITNCYTTPSITSTGSFAGGLVGRTIGGTISNSYSIGAVASTATSVGGFVGQRFAGTISNCYFDAMTSGISSGTGAQATSALQTPTSATGIYANWDEDVWDFGTNTQYPVLKVDFDQDGSTDNDLRRQRT